MVALLRLPPPLTLIIVLAVAAYVIYHIVSTGTAQPLMIIVLILLGFGLIRSLFRIRHKPQQNNETE